MSGDYRLILSDSKSPQLASTFPLSFSNPATSFWTVSALHQICTSSNLISIIGTNLTFVFHFFLWSLARFCYLITFLLSFVSTCDSLAQPIQRSVTILSFKSDYLVWTRCWSEWQSSRPFLNNFIKIFASTKIVTCGKSMISRRYINIITVYLFNLWRYFPSSGFIFHPVLIFSRLVIFAFDFKISFVFVSPLSCPFIFWTWMSLKSISNTYFASSLIWSFWFWVPVLTSRQWCIGSIYNFQ